jgi:hypothetical protein
MRRHLPSALALSFLGLFVGCAEEAPPSSAKTADEADVVAKDLSDAAEVFEDRLVFPADLIDDRLRRKIAAYAEALEEGNEDEVEKVILVGDRESDAVLEDGTVDDGSPNPQGFMRRALSLEEDGDEVIIWTEPASLEEVFTELDENGEIDIGAEPSDGPPSGGAQARETIQVPTIPLVDISGLEIYRNGDDYIRLPSAYVHLDLALDVGVEVKRLRLEQTHVIVSGDIESELQVEASIYDTPPSLGIPISKEIFVAKYPLPPLGPVPMTIALRLSVGCTISGGGFNVIGGAGTNVHFTGGVEYTRKGGVKEVGSATHDPYFVDPSGEILEHHQVTTRCSVEPRIEVLFYDVAGPMVKAEAYADFRFSTAPDTLSLAVGLEGKMGGTLRVFGHKIGDLGKTVFQRHDDVWSTSLD